MNVDVLPDRKADTFRAWLEAYPGVGVVCRDGSAAYAQAAANVLPDAVQVTDRWHVWKNFAEAALKEVRAHAACWAKGGPASTATRQAQNTLQRWRSVHDLLDKGVGLLECARRLQLSLNTVKRYAKASEPERLRSAPQYRTTLVDPYRDFLRERRKSEPAVSVAQLLREIKELGYTGTSNLLHRYINQGRVESDRRPVSPRRLTSLILTDPARLSDRQRDLLAELTGRCPQMKALLGHTRNFAMLLRPKASNADDLEAWIAAVGDEDLPHLHSFTRGLEEDHAAVTAAVTSRSTTAAPKASTRKPSSSCARCTDAQASGSSATESCSDPTTDRYHRNCDRSRTFVVGG